MTESEHDLASSLFALSSLLDGVLSAAQAWHLEALIGAGQYRNAFQLLQSAVHASVSDVSAEVRTLMTGVARSLHAVAPQTALLN